MTTHYIRRCIISQLKITWLMSASAAVMLPGCGTDQKQFYEESLKNYGSLSSNGGGAEDELLGGADALPWDPNQSEEQNGSDPTNSPPTLSPDTPIAHSYMQLSFDTAEVLKLRSGREPEAAGFILRNQVQQRMSNAPDNHAIMRQNFGDGIATSEGTVHILAQSADEQLPENDPSVSGVTSYIREIGHPDCPNTLVCAKSLKHTPTSGEAFTTCFYDPITSQRTVLPISPATNYRQADFLGSEGLIGTYRVNRYTETVDCDHTDNATIYASEVINVNLHVAASVGLSQLPERLHEVLPAQYGVTLNFNRTENDDVAPYIDETIRLDHVSHNFMNEDERVLVQTINETRASVSGVPMVDGVQFKLVLTLCTDYLSTDETNYCDDVNTELGDEVRVTSTK